MFQTVFPFTAEHTDWQTFNGNLIMYYGQEPLPITSEEDWHITAKNLIGTPSFSSYGLPEPDEFVEWQDWAKDFILAINGPPSK